MQFSEALSFSAHALRANKVRTFLTALGLVIGNASVVLVVTISLLSRNLILDQIRGIGSNLIYASYESGGQAASQVEADYVKIADVDALRAQFADRIVAASPVMANTDRLLIGGREEDIAVIGTDDQYPVVRNMVLLAGRFMDASEVQTREKVAMLTEQLAKRLYGSQESAIGQTLKIHQLEFTVIGTFREKTQSFGMSELSDETVLIPITVLQYFTSSERVDPMYVQAKDANDVEGLTRDIRAFIESRHRPGARYRVANLGAILAAASSTALVLTIVLVLVSAIALIISGIGIMNIMLVTVTERTREIGVRMAVGASRHEITLQFLTEAVLISIGGGIIGILLGISFPLTAQIFAGDAVHIPISSVSILVAFFVSFIVGIVFGILPARRASQLNPTEALRYE
jgi:putative ABC transport system permease protein